MAHVVRFTTPLCADGSRTGQWDWAEAWGESIPACSWLSYDTEIELKPAGEYPVLCLTVNNDYTIKTKYSGQGNVWRNGQNLGGTNYWPGGNDTIITYSDNFCHLLMNCGNLSKGISIVICCMYYDNKYLSNFKIVDGSFNSINDLVLKDASNNSYSFPKIFNYSKESGVIDVSPQPITPGIPDSGFITCSTLPISGARNHMVANFNNSEYYCIGTNTLIKMD